MLIGCSRQPSCLSPSGSKRTDSGIAYYRLYRQNLTYLYFRGFDIRAIVRFQERLQLELRKFLQFTLKFSLFGSVSILVLITLVVRSSSWPTHILIGSQFLFILCVHSEHSGSIHLTCLF